MRIVKIAAVLILVGGHAVAQDRSRGADRPVVRDVACPRPMIRDMKNQDASLYGLSGRSRPGASGSGPILVPPISSGPSRKRLFGVDGF